MISKYWNKSPLGLFKAIYLLSKVFLIFTYEKINSFFWKFNFADIVENLIVQKGTQIRFPKNISFAKNTSIGRDVVISSEIKDSILICKENFVIAKEVTLDFTGDVFIGKNVLISEKSVILSHDHGYDPNSKPEKSTLYIDDNVWIGQNSLILPSVNKIGKNSIIAAGSVLTKDVEENSIVAGNPAKKIKSL